MINPGRGSRICFYLSSWLFVALVIFLCEWNACIFMCSFCMNDVKMLISVVIDRCRDWICFYLHSWCFVVNLTHVLSGVVVLLCFADFSCQEQSRI